MRQFYANISNDVINTNITITTNSNAPKYKQY